MLENYDLKIRLRRSFTIHVVLPSAQGGIQYSLCNCHGCLCSLFWRSHGQYNAALSQLTPRQFFPVPNVAFSPEMHDTPLKEVKTLLPVSCSLSCLPFTFRIKECLSYNKCLELIFKSCKASFQQNRTEQN